MTEAIKHFQKLPGLSELIKETLRKFKKKIKI